MSAAKHTPGPWSLFPTETGWIVNEAGGPGYVCTLPSVSHRREECKANASLMVAAPDLLAALKDCREALRRAGATGELAVVDAVIAKATGAAS